MLKSIISFFDIYVIIYIIITFHELGHYIFSKYVAKVQPSKFRVGIGFKLYKRETEKMLIEFKILPFFGKVDADLENASNLGIRLSAFGGPLFSGIICCLALMYSINHGYMNILNFIDLSLKYISFELSGISYDFNDDFIKSLYINILMILAFFSATINLIPMYLADGSFVIFGNKTEKYKKILIVNSFIFNISLGYFTAKFIITSMLI